MWNLIYQRIEIDILNLIDEMEIPEQIQPIINRCISAFFLYSFRDCKCRFQKRNTETVGKI